MLATSLLRSPIFERCLNSNPESCRNNLPSYIIFTVCVHVMYVQTYLVFSKFSKQRTLGFVTKSRQCCMVVYTVKFHLIDATYICDYM